MFVKTAVPWDMIKDMKNICVYMCNVSANLCLPEYLCMPLYVQDALPPKEMNPAEKHCKQADIVLCLGTR